MKPLLLLFAFCVILASGYSCKQPVQSTAPKENTAGVLKEFYTRYMTELALDTDMPRMEKRLDSIKREYCTLTLLKRIIADSLDYDPLINAQDADTAWLKTLVITEGLKKSNQYKVSYTDGRDSSIIHLQVLDDKIDSVW